jgi:hypothetical protein
MQKAIWTLVMFSLLGAASAAQAYEVTVQAFVAPNVVTAQACNLEANTTVACTVNAIGYLNAGFPIYGTATLVLTPGACDYAYVYATAPYYFVNGMATGNCVPYSEDY